MNDVQLETQLLSDLVADLIIAFPAAPPIEEPPPRLILTPEQLERLWRGVVSQPAPPREKLSPLLSEEQVAQVLSSPCRVKQTKDYGRMVIDGAVRAAHCVSFEHYVGPIPTGFVVDHLCGVRQCRQHDGHLEAVTNKVNSQRAHTKALCPHRKGFHTCDSCRPEQKKESRRIYYEANSERENERGRACYEVNSEKAKERNRARYAARKRADPEGLKDYNRKYYVRAKLKKEALRKALTKSLALFDQSLGEGVVLDGYSPAHNSASISVT